LDFKATCPTVQGFVERFREHPVMKSICIKHECYDAMIKRASAKEPGVKSQLSIVDLVSLDVKN